MYAQISQFAIDKSTNVIVEEGIAPVYIREYWARQGRKVQVHYNLENGLTGRREYDLYDTFGTRWEVKCDHKWHLTGNVYLESQSLSHSKADYYLILAGIGYVVSKSALSEAIAEQSALTPGGDQHRSLGLLLPLERLEEMAQAVIVP